MGEAPHKVYTDLEKEERTEKVCGNCKWWKEIERSEDQKRNPEDYGFTKDSLRYGNCGSPKFSYQNHKGLDGVMYEDAESYAANLETGPLFGCIHFEPK